MSPGVTSHPGDVTQNVIHQVRPPSTIALYFKVLLLVYPLVVLLPLDSGQHGHPDWSAAIQPHVKDVEICCVFWCLSIRTIMNFYSSRSSICWSGPHRPTFTPHEHQGTDDNHQFIGVSNCRTFDRYRPLWRGALRSHSHIAFKTKCLFVVTYILQLLWLKDTWCNVLLMSMIKMLFLICVRLHIVLIIYDVKTDGQN